MHTTFARCILLNRKDARANTFLVAAAITQGELEIVNCEPRHLTTVIEKLRTVGVEIEDTGERCLRVS